MTFYLRLISRICCCCCMQEAGLRGRDRTCHRNKEVGGQNDDIAHGNAALQGALSRRLGCGSNLYITITAQVRKFTLLISIQVGRMGIIIALSDAAAAAVRCDLEQAAIFV